MIPRDAQNVANAHKYINHTLNPETAAKNGNYVTYAPASRPARDLMDEKYTSDESIFPSKELMEKKLHRLSQVNRCEQTQRSPVAGFESRAIIKIEI